MTDDEKLDLLITFFEQERDYAKESADSGAHTPLVVSHLTKRIQWHNTLIGVLKEAKTEEGITRLKDAIEKEKKRKREMV
jgi:hypothetical protein